MTINIPEIGFNLLIGDKKLIFKIDDGCFKVLPKLDWLGNAGWECCGIFFVRKPDIF